MLNTEVLKERWHKSDEKEIDSSIYALLEHRHGRRMLWWLLRIGGIGGQPFATNALITAFNCGELNIGQQILARIITVSPEGYVKMMKENQDESRERSEQLAGRGNSSGRDTDSDDGDDAGTD